MNYKKLIDWLAEKEHEQWSHWTKYMLERLEKLEREQDADDPYKIMHEKNKWRKQIKTPYNKLTIDEKESDKEWAIKIIDEIPFKCPMWQCGGIMKSKERPLPNSDPKEYDGDWQSPDLICSNCKAIYQFKGFRKERK